MKMLCVVYESLFDDPITDVFKRGEIPKLIQIVRDLKTEYPPAGLAAFTFPLEELVL